MLFLPHSFRTLRRKLYLLNAKKPQLAFHSCKWFARNPFKSLLFQWFVIVEKPAHFYVLMGRMDAKNRKTKEGRSARTLESLLGDLKKSRLKLTEPRKAILFALFDNHGPFTAEEIHKLVTKRVCDLATVYRCLASLEEAHILRRVEFGDDSSRYELTEADDTHHHHLICTQCKRIEIVDDPDIEDIDRFAKKRGFSNVSHTLEFFGTCPECK